MNYWENQAQYIEQHALTPKHGLLWSPRLGKSLGAGGAMLKACDVLGYTKGFVSCPLVVAPMWVETLTHLGLPAIECFGTSVREATARLGQAREGIAVINDDRAAQMLDALALWGPQANIIDESHRMKGVSSNRGKALRALSHLCQWTRLLTGTPVPNHYGDLWGQFNALDSREWGTSYYGRGGFAERFLILDTQYRSRVLGHKNVGELQAMLLRYASILRREDVFGPDHFQFIVRDVPMPERAWALYHRLAKLWVLDEPNIEAANNVVRLLRLQQITSGFLPDGEEGMQQIHTAKIDAIVADLSEIIESDEKAVVFHHYSPEGRAVYDDIRGKFKEKNLLVVKIDGDTSKDGFAIAEKFNAHTGPAVAVVQTRAGGIGISLKEATHALVLSQNYSFSDAEQARDRIYKQGARRVVAYYRVGGTVDTYVGDILARKENLHEAVRHADVRELVYGTFATRRAI